MESVFVEDFFTTKSNQTLTTEELAFLVIGGIIK